MVIQFLAWSESVVYGQDVLTRFRTAIQIEIENLLQFEYPEAAIDDPADPSQPGADTAESA